MHLVQLTSIRQKRIGQVMVKEKGEIVPVVSIIESRVRDMDYLKNTEMNYHVTIINDFHFRA